MSVCLLLAGRGKCPKNTGGVKGGARRSHTSAHCSHLPCDAGNLSEDSTFPPLNGEFLLNLKPAKIPLIRQRAGREFRRLFRHPNRPFGPQHGMLRELASPINVDAPSTTPLAAQDTITPGDTASPFCIFFWGGANKGALNVGTRAPSCRTSRPSKEKCPTRSRSPHSSRAAFRTRLLARSPAALRLYGRSVEQKVEREPHFPPSPPPQVPQNWGGGEKFQGRVERKAGEGFQTNNKADGSNCLLPQTHVCCRVPRALSVSTAATGRIQEGSENDRDR